MSFIGATGLNTFHEEIENTSNYATRISLDSSNYTSNVNFNLSNDTSNYTSNQNINSSNYIKNVNINNISYTGNVNINSSNYTERINNDLSDRIGFPALLFPVTLPSGVYVPLKAQEVILSTLGELVGAQGVAITSAASVAASAFGIATGAAAAAGIGISKADAVDARVTNLIPYDLPQASAFTRGGVKIGINLTLVGDVLSGLLPPNLAPYRLINDSYTKAEVDTKDTNNSNVISLRINAIPAPPNLAPYRLVSDSYTKAEVDTKDTNNSNVISLRINAIPAPPDLAPYRLVTDSYTKAEDNLSYTNNSNYTTNTSNLISTRINNLPQPNLTPYRLVSDSYTKTEVDTIDTNTSNVISTRINNLPQPNLTPYRLVSDSYTKTEVDTIDTNTSNVISTRINNIPSTVSSQWATSGANINYSSGNVGIGVINNSFKLNVEGALKVLDTITAANIYVSSRVGVGGFNDGTSSLYVNGLTKITEAIGTVAGANSGSLLLDHENVGGASSITFRSKVNRGSDYGYIQYQDANVINGGGESARLIIGVQNDGDDHICLMPSGNVGIGLLLPRQKLEVQGNIIANGEIACTNVRLVNAFCTGQVECITAIITNRLDCGLIASTNRIAATTNVTINNFNCPFISFNYTNVTEYNGSRMFEFPIRATNAFIYLYFGDIGSHTLFIKQGDSYNKRMGAGGNGWDFSESYNGNVRNWYHWRNVGDRITAICYWFNNYKYYYIINGTSKWRRN